VLLDPQGRLDKLDQLDLLDLLVLKVQQVLLAPQDQQGHGLTEKFGFLLLEDGHRRQLDAQTQQK